MGVKISSYVSQPDNLEKKCDSNTLQSNNSQWREAESSTDSSRYHPALTPKNGRKLRTKTAHNKIYICLYSLRCQDKKIENQSRYIGWTYPKWDDLN